MHTDTRFDLAEADVLELEDSLVAAGEPRFHARQIFQWIHRRGVTGFAVQPRRGDRRTVDEQPGPNHEVFVD